MKITRNLLPLAMVAIITGCSNTENSQPVTQTPPPTQSPSASGTGTTPSTTETTAESKTGSGAGTESGTIHGTIRQTGDKLILTDTPDKMDYTLNDASAAKPYVGKMVTITGHIDHGSKMIHVHEVQGM